MARLPTVILLLVEFPRLTFNYYIEPIVVSSKVYLDGVEGQKDDKARMASGTATKSGN